MKRAMICALVMTVAMSAGADKTGRTYYDDAKMARMHSLIEEHDWAQSQVDAARQNAEWYLQFSDEELWEFVPPPEQMRAINVHIGHDCPNCGDEITRKAGHYPWEMDRDNPFKVTCPVCGETFPKNDFQPWNTEGLEGEPATGEVPTDNGLGWMGPDGRRYWFVPYYIFWQRWVKDILGGMETLGQAYLLTGETKYARAAAVMMAKLASEYERFEYRTQGYHEGRFNIPGRISDRIWTTGDDTRIALAYDAIWPVFDEAPELLAFLKTKGIDDPRRTIEQEMLAVMERDVLGGVDCAGNMGMHQRTACVLAIVLNNEDPDYAPTTAEMREWLMQGGGRVEDLLWNGFWRDGMGAESSPSYSSSWIRNFYEIADLLPKLGVQIWDNPKLKKMADIGIDMAVNNRWGPSIGDCGGPGGGGPIGRWTKVLGQAFTHFGEPRHAQLLAAQDAKSRDLFEDWFDEDAVARAVEEHGMDLDLGTRDIGGYGLAILESGEGDDARGMSLYYGSAEGGHGHHDRLNIELWALGRPMLPEDGYPYPFTKPDFWHWRQTDTHKHYCVVIDESSHHTLRAGDLNALLATPQVQFVDAFAESVYPGTASLYRRTAALIDISPESSYLLDIFRVRGGSQHDWCFHGPIFFDLSLDGGEMGPTREEGTLAGPNVPFGVKPHRAIRGGLPMHLLRAEGLLPGEDYRTLSEGGWAICNESVLTKQGAGARGASLKMQTAPLPTGEIRVFAHVYDYAEGANALDVTAAGTTATIPMPPADEEGWRWIEAPITLAEAATEVTITAREVGQVYIQLDQLVFVDDPNLDHPRVVGDGTSGYHGLYNVRRMSPDGQWRAMWRKSDEDACLTMTMPAGIADEVIACDARPEVRPGNPDEIQYVLGRRLLPLAAMDAGGQLASTFVATAEPHRGEAAIRSVELLSGSEPERGTVGVAVHRDGAVDLVHSVLSPERREWTFDGQTLAVEGEYALVTLDDAGVVRAMLVNGTELRIGDFTLQGEEALEATVTGVDFASNSITIDAQSGDPQALVGRVIILGNDLQTASYTVEEAEAVEGGTRLGFGDVLFVVGMGEVTDAEDGVVTSDRNLQRHPVIDGGHHEGRWLFNEDRSEGWRIRSLTNTQFTLQDAPEDLPAAFADANADGRRLYWISEIGVGDTCRIPAVTWYEREE